MGLGAVGPKSRKWARTDGLSSTYLEIGDTKVRLVPKRFDYGLYAFARALVDGFNHLYLRVEVIGAEKVPAPPYILSPTHRSNIDSILLGSVTHDHLRFLGKSGLWKYRSVGRLITALGGIPVNREIADREAMDNSLAILGSGQPLVLFPEGTRKEGPRIEAILDGAAYIALKAQVPIVPLGIAGTDKAMAKGVTFPRPARCVVLVGDPLTEGVREAKSGSRVPRSKVREMTTELQATLQELYDGAKGRL